MNWSVIITKVNHKESKTANALIRTGLIDANDIVEATKKLCKLPFLVKECHSADEAHIIVDYLSLSDTEAHVEDSRIQKRNDALNEVIDFMRYSIVITNTTNTTSTIKVMIDLLGSNILDSKRVLDELPSTVYYTNEINRANDYVKALKQSGADAHYVDLKQAERELKINDIINEK